MINNIIWHTVIDNKSSYFEKYLKLIKNTADEEQRLLNEKAKELSKVKRSPEDLTGCYDTDDYLSDLAYEAEQMEQLMYSSFVVSLFMFMESQITSLCDVVKDYHGETFSHKDLGGVGGTNRSIKYLRLVLKTNFPAEDSTAREFEVAHIIRNALVHKDGELKDKNELDKINLYINSNAETILLQNNRVSITHKYAESLIKLNQKICEEIIKHNKVKDF